MLPDGTVVVSHAGALDFETETEVTLTATARLADGRMATNAVRIADAVDAIRGTDAAEELVGRESADALAGLGGDDWLWARGGDDRLDGGAGADVLLGEAGRDTLAGDGGSDVLSGGAGDDVLTGGAGDDMFVFLANEGADVVKDFVVGRDKIVLVGHAAPALSLTAEGALVHFGGTDILLEGVHSSSLSMQDFLFLESLG